MTLKPVTRVFVIANSKQNLADPNPALKPAEVMAHYTGQFPALANAEVSGGEVKNGRQTYTFTARVEKKG